MSAPLELDGGPRRAYGWGMTDRRNPETAMQIPNGRRIDDPRVPRSIYPFMIGLGVQPPPERSVDRGPVTSPSHAARLRTFRVANVLRR